MAAAQVVPIGYRRKLDERLLLALEVMPVAVNWVRLEDGATEFCNDKFVDLFGYTVSELPTVFDLFRLAYAEPEIKQRATDHMRGIIGNPLTEQVEFPNMEFDIIAKDGVRKTVLFGGVVIPDGGMALATYLEITAQKERAQLVQRLAEEDPLTGLPNRRVFDRYLNAAMAGLHQGEMVHLLLLDLDGFKLINDTNGHAVGDQILIEVGRRLQAVVRRSDVIARWGGDEFCILAASRGDDADISTLRARILGAFTAPFTVCGNDYRVGATIGEAQFPSEAGSAIGLFKLADERMYQAKKASGGRP